MIMRFQELRNMHEELVKQKSGFQSRIQTRDEEIGRLRNQVCSRCWFFKTFTGRRKKKSHNQQTNSLSLMNN